MLGNDRRDDHTSIFVINRSFWPTFGLCRGESDVLGIFEPRAPSIGGGGVGGTAPVETNHVLPGYRGRLEGLVEIDSTMGSSRYGQTAPF